MNILFANGNRIPITINNSPVSATIKSIYKHLQHVDLPFRPWDNPFYLKNLSYKQLVDILVDLGKIVGVEIDNENCSVYNQMYLNRLHKIYEKNYNGKPEWLDFHEHIHLCEHHARDDFPMIINLDFRELAGPLEKKIDPAWTTCSATVIKKGDAYWTWAELGKDPYGYWKDEEPNDITRLCELAKPWMTLRPKIEIALQDIDKLADKNVQEFTAWWQNYQSQWCQHWGINSWTIENMFGVMVIGNIEQIDEVEKLLKHNVYPSRVTLF